MQNFSLISSCDGSEIHFPKLQPRSVNPVGQAGIKGTRKYIFGNLGALHLLPI